MIHALAQLGLWFLWISAACSLLLIVWAALCVASSYIFNGWIADEARPDYDENNPPGG